jgi:hypothetical protein
MSAVVVKSSRVHVPCNEIFTTSTGGPQNRLRGTTTCKYNLLVHCTFINQHHCEVAAATTTTAAHTSTQSSSFQCRIRNDWNPDLDCTLRSETAVRLDAGPAAGSGHIERQRRILHAHRVAGLAPSQVAGTAVAHGDGMEASTDFAKNSLPTYPDYGMQHTQYTYCTLMAELGKRQEDAEIRRGNFADSNAARTRCRFNGSYPLPSDYGFVAMTSDHSGRASMDVTRSMPTGSRDPLSIAA